jgi:hypothetical protein
MGVWGAGNFENDTALDRVWDLQSGEEIRRQGEGRWKRNQRRLCKQDRI